MEFKKALNLLNVSFSHSDYPNIINLAKRIGKAILIFDTETTGLLGIGHVGIVEFAFIAINVDGTSQSASVLINPEMDIPASASAIHGIYEKDVIDAIKFNSIVPVLDTWLKDCVVSGYNTRGYDVKVINQNLAKNGHEAISNLAQLDVRDVWMRVAKTQRGKLVDVAKNYGVIATDAHRAMGDVLTTVKLFEAMLNKHGEDCILESLIGYQMPNQAVQTKTPSTNKPTALTMMAQGKFVSQSERVQTAIKAHVSQHKKIGLSDYPSIVKTSGSIISVSAISFAISDMFSRGELTEEQLIDENCQAVISSKLESVIGMVGAERLKPIKEGLDAATGLCIDYVQLRIAMSNRANATFTSPINNHSAEFTG